VIDPREAWVFHITPDPTQRSAVWCAQRVPDDHIASVANSFTIRQVAMNDSSTFLFSSNFEAAAAATGRWSPGGHPIDFTGVFSGPENGKKYSSGRRMWRIYTLLGDDAAAAALSATYTEYVSSAPYPATFPARRGGVTLANMTTVMRDFYAGTPYDMSDGAKAVSDGPMSSGPAGTPDRWMRGQGESQVEGAWERAISISRTIVSYVCAAVSVLSPLLVCSAQEPAFAQECTLQHVGARSCLLVFDMNDL
jgi:dipeptidase